jgi:hypothetical protein
MSPDQSKRQDLLDAFVDVAGQINAPLSTRQRTVGWQRLQQALASRRSPPVLPLAWFRTRRLQLWTALAFAVVVIPVAWRIAMRPERQALRYFVSGEVAIDARGVLSAQRGAAQLTFTDGSRLDMRARAQLSIAALKPKGSDIRLVDGIIDVDVKHQSGTAWTFDAGPYVILVKGTSFALGWDAARAHLALRMRSGSVAVVGPGGAGPFTVVATESIFLDGAGKSLGSAPADDTPVAPTPPGAAASTAPLSHVGDTTSAVRRFVGRKDRAAFVHGDWASLLAHGRFEAIVEQAKKSGIDACLTVETEQNLAALADAARYTQRFELARRSLLSLRARFPSTDRARDAAFFLARLSETTGPNAREALSWYDRYLGDTAGGSYAEEALGREMDLLHRNDRSAAARSVAGRYLKAYPHGIYAKAASDILETDSAP